MSLTQAIREQTLVTTPKLTSGDTPTTFYHMTRHYHLPLHAPGETSWLLLADLFFTA
jgi:hypothetical protein